MLILSQDAKLRFYKATSDFSNYQPNIYFDIPLNLSVNNSNPPPIQSQPPGSMQPAITTDSIEYTNEFTIYWNRSYILCKSNFQYYDKTTGLPQPESHALK